MRHIQSEGCRHAGPTVPMNNRKKYKTQRSSQIRHPQVQFKVEDGYIRGRDCGRYETYTNCNIPIISSTLKWLLNIAQPPSILAIYCNFFSLNIFVLFQTKFLFYHIFRNIFININNVGYFITIIRIILQMGQISSG